MKRIVLLISLFISTLVFSVSVQTTPVWAGEIAQLKATVVKVSGDVLIRSRGSLVSHDAKVDEVLSAGDEIETKEKGQIEIRIENGNTINLKPKSKLVLKTLTRNLKTGDYENLLEVDRGKFRAKVEKIKGSSRFEVKSPTAVACVRGTIMYLIVFSDSTTAFFEEGVGFVTNPFSGQSFDVNPGNIYQIDENGNVTGPVIPTPEQLQDMIGGWDVGGGEGYSGPGGGDDLGGDTGSNYNFDDAMNDIRNSWDAYFGSGVNNTGGGTGTITETDTDGDGIPDSIDEDDDNDKYTDTDEIDNETDPLLAESTPPDNDEDFVSDLNDTDDDNDGLLDTAEGPNGTGTDPLLADTDDDGITDNLEANTDLVGLIDDYDTDDDNDGLLDTLETRWSDANLNTNPLDPDTDDDGVNDLEDAFPKDPTRTGSRNSIRLKEKELIDFTQLRTDRTAYLAAAERAALLADINAIIEESENRRIDSVLEQIADAQTGKVLKDRLGNRVRVEQYVIRPSSDTVEVLNVNLRTGGDHAGLSTLDWTTRFGGQNLDNLNGEQLRALPWNDYLEAPTSGNDLVGWGPKYSREPSYYPTLMSIELKNPSGNAFCEKRELNSPETKRWWFGEYRQYVIKDQISVNGGKLENFTVDRSEGSGRGNPNGFRYNPAGSGESDIIEFNFYVISDDPNVGRIGGMGTKNFNNMWEALAVNMDGVPNRMKIGNRNLEIRISGSAYEKDIDLIYVPFTRLDWNDSHDWLNEEGPR